MHGSLEKPGIMLDNNDNILKFFYPRGHFFSITTLRPAASNFVENAKKLKGRGIALLDIQNTHFSFSKLGPFRRARNLRHLLNTKEDIDAYLSYGVEKFIEGYLRHANLSTLELKLFVLQFNFHSSNHQISTHSDKR